MVDLILKKSMNYGNLMVAYKTAYLKANYPAEYMTACMTAESGDIETCSEYITEARRMGFTILPPDINESFSDFTVVVENDAPTKNIRFGLNNIKNFGEEIGKAIIAERKTNGKYRSIEDFLERVQHKNLNKKSLEALIMCGALDAFGERGNLLANLETLLTFHKDIVHAGPVEHSLFGTLGADAPKSVLTLSETPPADMPTKLTWEKELLGLYLSGHPLDQFEEQIEKSGNTISSLIEKKNPKNQILVVLIESVKPFITKSNTRMAFIAVRDRTGMAEAVLFPEGFKEYGAIATEGAVVVIQCSVSDKNDRKSIIIDKLKRLN